MTAELTLPALQPEQVAEVEKTGYPPPFNERVRGRLRRALGNACGLTQFGVNLTTLLPGAQSALRHWHTREDEFIYVLSGELILVTNDGEQLLAPGHCAGFPGGKQDGHHLINRGSTPAQYLEIGSRLGDDLGVYPDDDLALILTVEGKRFVPK